VFSDDTKAFIRSSIRSVWALELLLFMRRHDGEAWTAEALARELRSSTFAIKDILDTFSQAGLATAEGGTFRYAPATPHLDRAVRELEAAYAVRPLAVSREILAGSNKIQTFADAFKLKKDDP
jgi:hypothetical protein